MRGTAEHEFEAPTPTKPLTRDYLKCPQCRRDGKKCVTRNDSTDNPATKCFRCTRLGHPCGPRERAPGRPRGRVTCNGRDISNNSASQTNSRELRQPGIQIDSTQNSICPNSALDLSELGKLVATNRLLFRCRCELTLLLKKIPNDAVLVQQDIYLRAFATRLNAQYRAFVEKFIAETHRYPHYANTGLMSKFEILHHKFDILQLQHLRLDTAIWQPELGTVSRQSGTWWFIQIDSPFGLWTCLCCTDRIAAGVDPASLQLRQTLSNVKSIPASEYSKAQAQLVGVLGRLGNQNEESDQGGPSSAWDNGVTDSAFCYPAAHLAYWNFDIDTAFEMATCSGTLELPADTMNQTLVHIAVKARDIGFLKRLIDFDKDAFMKASEAPGHTPLELATILDDQDIFGLLIGRGANLSPRTEHLLELAVAANSPSIVDVILERGMIVLPPYTKAAAAAIEKGLEDIALRFVQWLKPPWTEPCELEMLLMWAEQMDLHRLMAALRVLAPVPIPIGRPVESLRQHLAFLTAAQTEETPGSDPSSFSSFHSNDAWSHY